MPLHEQPIRAPSQEPSARRKEKLIKIPEAQKQCRLQAAELLALALQFGGLLEFTGTATAIGEMGKRLIEGATNSTQQRPPGQPRASYTAHETTFQSNLQKEAKRHVGELKALIFSRQGKDFQRGLIVGRRNGKKVRNERMKACGREAGEVVERMNKMGVITEVVVAVVKEDPGVERMLKKVDLAVERPLGKKRKADKKEGVEEGRIRSINVHTHPKTLLLIQRINLKDKDHEPGSG
ncbi:uncharacterized protein EI90DRAFT_3023216 [Cantharellus anzutake]|uniref:uncharacterized protein n=1 Tax=Cantharellus anzutake TaxID=1750568 RepID=UPI001904EF7D|nr:uncharacterized protein EI90DRAFT_3023216 [Cantharellus anzutake]KAF8312152.1 hypothetical protein EI90DRAFT_3023216 [Cantharellus anzutake]